MDGRRTPSDGNSSHDGSGELKKITQNFDTSNSLNQNHTSWVVISTKWLPNKT
jgi:hypothetical protein